MNGGNTMRRVIDECEGCRDVCLRAVIYCLGRGGSLAEASHMTTLLDCIRDLTSECEKEFGYAVV